MGTMKTKNTSIDTLASNITTAKWLSSKETMARLGITGCELMHKRESGELTFKKLGNSYLYLFNTQTV